MDAVDRARGGLLPREMPLGEHAAIAKAAIESGATTQTWDCIFDAIVFLEELHQRLK
jgi:hypothetical protein